MDAAGKDAAQDDPDKAGPPAVLGGQDRSDQRSRTSDRGKMMAEDHPLVGGNEILAVITGDGRCNIPVIQHHHLGCDEGRVITVSQSKGA